VGGWGAGGTSFFSFFRFQDQYVQYVFLAPEAFWVDETGLVLLLLGEGNLEVEMVVPVGRDTRLRRMLGDSQVRVCKAVRLPQPQLP
jgi:hypothetical protein